MKKKLVTKRGDTLLEVVLAFSIFSLVMTLAIVTMNSSLSRLEGALELSLTRTEIDAQAEALRFVHNAYVRNPNDEEGTYYQLWSAITGQANESMTALPTLQPSDCRTLYSDQPGNIYGAKAFILNARNIKPRQGTDASKWTESLIKAEIDGEIFKPSDLYARLVYAVSPDETNEDVLQEVEDFTELARAEGIYVTEVRGSDKTFWDFYIYTCFNQPGTVIPTTIGTTVRLYDPDF